jgi:hypothetical protein
VAFFATTLHAGLVYKNQKRRTQEHDKLRLNSANSDGNLEDTRRPWKSGWLLLGLSFLLALLATIDAVQRATFLGSPTGGFYESPHGAQIYLECEGAGSPTVVFETGWGTTRSMEFIDQHSAALEVYNFIEIIVLTHERTLFTH